jgi:hypothetical protein
MPLFPQCVYSNPAGVPYTMTPNVAGWVAPYIPTVLPCCEMPQVRNFVEESILQGLETVIAPQMTDTYNLLNTIELDLLNILTELTNSTFYAQGMDTSATFTLPLAITTLPTITCKQVVLIAPVNGFWLVVNSGGEMFIPPYTTLPVNVTNVNRLRARYQTAGDTLFYYYH